MYKEEIRILKIGKKRKKKAWINPVDLRPVELRATERDFKALQEQRNNDIDSLLA